MATSGHFERMRKMTQFVQAITGILERLPNWARDDHEPSLRIKQLLIDVGFVLCAVCLIVIVYRTLFP